MTARAWGGARRAVRRAARLAAARLAAARLAVGALSAAALLAGCAPLLGARALAAARPGETTLHTLRVAGRERAFLLHLPPAAARGRVPLVLALHGDGGSGAVLRETTRLDRAADAAGVAVAYPNGTGRLGWLLLGWHADRHCCGRALARGVDDVGYVDAVLAALRAVPALAVDRVAVVGFSAGGTLALRLACARADRVAAVADVAGTMPDVACAPARPISTLFVQGAADDELRGELRLLRHRRAPHRTHSLDAALRWWAARAGCGRDGRPVTVARDSTAARVRETAVDCPPGLAAELWTVADHPHAWPGGLRPWPFAPRPAPSVDASALVLAFFARTAFAPLPGGAAPDPGAVGR